MYNGNGNTKQWANPSHLFLTTWYKGYFSRKGQVESLKTVPPLEKKKKRNDAVFHWEMVKLVPSKT